MFHPSLDATYFNQLSQGHFPADIGITILEVSEGKLIASLPITKRLFAPNGFLHAGSIVTFADTLAGYSTVAHLPERAKSFTTLELKSNFLGAAREGTLIAESRSEHRGKTTQVWSVEVKAKELNKKIAVFSCTQLILY